jgi:phosphoribosylcarboxyaminoimidazole (NCAIR) mutase
MGSDSDLPLMAPAARVLKDFGVSCSVTIVSAHRTPERMFEFARTAHTAGCKVLLPLLLMHACHIGACTWLSLD